MVGKTTCLNLVAEEKRDESHHASAQSDKQRQVDAASGHRSAVGGQLHIIGLKQKTEQSERNSAGVVHFGENGLPAGPLWRERSTSRSTLVRTVGGKGRSTSNFSVWKMGTVYLPPQFGENGLPADSVWRERSTTRCTLVRTVYLPPQFRGTVYQPLAL